MSRIFSFKRIFAPILLAGLLFGQHGMINAFCGLWQSEASETRLRLVNQRFITVNNQYQNLMLEIENEENTEKKDTLYTQATKLKNAWNLFIDKVYPYDRKLYLKKDNNQLTKWEPYIKHGLISCGLGIGGYIISKLILKKININATASNSIFFPALIYFVGKPVIETTSNWYRWLQFRENPGTTDISNFYRNVEDNLIKPQNLSDDEIVQN